MARSRSPIALDFGEHSVKALQLELRGGELHVRAAGSARVATGDATDLGARQLDAARCALRQGAFRGRQARVALGLHDVGTRHLRLPAEQIERAGEHIAARIAAESDAEGALRLAPLVVADLFDQGEHKREYLCCIATDDAVATAIQRTEALGLEPQAIELATIAQCRPLLQRSPKDSFAHLDIGCGATRLTVVRAGEPVLMRTVAVGGERLLATLMERLQFDEAALLDLLAEPTDGEMVQRAVVDALAPLLAPVLQRTADGIRYCGALFHGRTVTALRLSGGSAHLPGLAAHLAHSIGITAEVVDPLPGVIDLPPSPPRAAWTTASGLALGGLPA